MGKETLPQKPFEFADESVWKTDALHRRLGSISTRFRTPGMNSGERGAQVLREANHIVFELEQRGEPWLVSPLAPMPPRKK